MKIIGVAWIGFAIPFRRPYLAANTQALVRYGLLTFLRADSGVVGIGEASPVGVGSRQEIENTATLLGRLAPQMLQEDLTALGGLFLPPAQDIPSFIRFGLETALLDMEGKAHGCPVAKLLGSVPAQLVVNALVTAEAPREAVSQVKEAVAQGFTSIKLKVAQGPLAQDEELISAVRQAIGPEVKLRVDANQGWKVSQAIEALHRLASYDIEYAEQPVSADDLSGLAEVRRAVSVPIAADESVDSLDGFHRLMAAEAADLFVIKAARLSGLYQTLELIRMATKSDKPVIVTSSLESGVGIAASAHLASTLPSHTSAHGLATGLLLREDLLVAPLVPRDGTLATPLGPGLGVELNKEVLGRYGIGIMGCAGSWHKCPWNG